MGKKKESLPPVEAREALLDSVMSMLVQETASHAVTVIEGPPLSIEQRLRRLELNQSMIVSALAACAPFKRTPG